MNKDNCIICYEKISEDENVKIKCGHTYCLNCFIKHMRIDNRGVQYVEKYYVKKIIQIKKKCQLKK